MALDPDDPKVRWAVFGRKVEYFLSSEIGEHIVARAKAESEEAMAEFKEADPFDGPAMAKIQARAKLADTVIGWLAEAIRAGESATEQLQIEQSEG